MLLIGNFTCTAIVADKHDCCPYSETVEIKVCENRSTNLGYVGPRFTWCNFGLGGLIFKSL